MGMKSLVPLVILLAGMFITGCTTPEDVFLGAPTPVAVAPKNPTSPAAKPDLAPTNAAPVEPVVVVQEKPAPVETEPAVVVTNAPPVAVETNAAPATPVAVVPDDAAPAATRPAVAPPVADPDSLPTIVTPDTSLAGKVVSYNSAGRFVLVNFPVGQMPKVDQTMFLYRNGLKIGEIKITGPQRETITVADVITGDAQVEDDVRDQ
jgi:hypothetical protein